MTPCRHCGEPLSEARLRRHAAFCSTHCSNEFTRAKYRAENARTGLATGTVGAIQELRVGADLLSRGFEVFRALSPACSCDLAALKDGKLIRVEVTTGYKTLTGKIMHPKKKHPYDVLAVVTHGEISYKPEAF